MSRLLTLIKRWLEPPVFPGDAKKTHQAQLMHALGIYYIGALLIVAIFLTPLFVAQKLATWAIILFLLIVYVVARYQFFRGRLEIAGMLIVGSAWVVFGGMAFLAGGITSPMNFAFIAVTIVITVLFQARIGNGFVFASILTGLGIAVSQQSGFVLPQYFTFQPIATWFLFALSLVFINNTINLVVRRLETALALAHQQTAARQLAEQALRQSEERFQMFMEYFPGLAYMKDSDGRNLFANAGFKTYLGLDPKEIVGKTNTAIFDPQFGEKISQDDQRVLESGSDCTIEEEFGGRNWMTQKFCINQPGAQPLLGGITLDITERKRAEQAVRESETRLRLSIDNMLEGYGLHEAIWDPQGRMIDYRFLEFNPAAQKISNLDRASIIGKTALELYPHIGERGLMDRYGQVMSTGESASFHDFYYQGDRLDKALDISCFRIDDRHFACTFRDTTERKQIENSLRESEHRLELAQSVAHVGSWELNLTARSMWASAEAFRIYGVEMPPNQIVPLTIAQQIPQPEERARLDAALDNLIWHNHPYNIEFTIKRADDGMVRVIHSIAQMVRDEQGKPVKVIGTIQDVTERNRAEDALRESEVLFRVAFENTLIGMVFTSLTGQLLKVNEAFCDMLGYTAAELQQVEFTALTHPDDQASSLNHMRQILQGEHPIYRFEKRYVHKNGQTVWVDLGVSLVYDSNGKPLHFITYAQDITNRKRAEQEVRQSEAKYRFHFENVADVIYSIDRELRITTISPSVERILGYAPSELIGKAYPELGLLAPESFKAAVANTIKVLAGERTIDEYAFIAKNGATLYGEITSTPLYDENNQVSGVISVARDITERKIHDHELHAIASVSAALRTATARDQMFPVIIQQISDLLKTTHVAIGLRDPDTNESIAVAGDGIWRESIGSRVPAGQGMSGRVFATQEIYRTDDLRTDPLFYSRQLVGDARGAACLPLIAHGQSIGWIFAGTLSTFTEQDIGILKAIADISANAIHRATLFEQAQQYADELEHAYTTTLEGWANALELRDRDTNGHAERVTRLTLELAQAMGISPVDLTHVRRGALLHDIGKMGIPDSILLKPGTLDEREWEIMKRHPEYAFKLLSPIEYLRPALDIPYCHHEKWDGTGYPRGLKGEAIPLVARIFAIVDVWDALCSDRPYRAAWSIEQSQKYIREQAGKHFDPRVVEQFLKSLGLP